MSTILEHYTSKDLVNRTSVRPGEERLGERLATISESDWTSADSLPYKFIIVGIEEDFGVRANHGRGGADRAFQSFLNYFLNMQVNRFFPTEALAILGAVVPTASVEDDNIEALREATAANDHTVSAAVRRITELGAIPIVIGGGHNNAYGCLKGSSENKGRAINCLNIDAHTDLRTTEGRHSGNGFTYAAEAGYMANYFMLGLQESYTPEYIWQTIEQNDAYNVASFEDLQSGELTQEEALIHVAEHLGMEYGLELDVDAIANFPSSAQSVSGFSFDQVRQIIYALDMLPHYFHVCEGRVTGQENHAVVGRGLALLVSDFIKAHIYSE
jgi:formiminoglutamase